MTLEQALWILVPAAVVLAVVLLMGRTRSNPALSHSRKAPPPPGL